jgi:chorismate-pyruvate lyase
MSLPRRGPALPDLYRLFAADAPPPEHELIEPAAMPEPYRTLLVHEHHMTVTVEEYYGGPVDVVVLQRKRDQNTYARKILLKLRSDERIVQSGIVRIRLDFCSEPVRAAILAEQIPVGRILIEHDVLRRIEPTAYFRLRPGPYLRHWFGRTDPFSTYGRLGIIYCDGQPAIDLLEVLAPIP